MLDWENLIKLYIPLIGWVSLGLILGYKLPREIPTYLGKFLFWVGVPIGIMIFLRQAELSAAVWLAPLVCWLAVLLGVGLAWLWIRANLALVETRLSRNDRWLGPWRTRLFQLAAPHQLRRKPTQGSFLLSTMVGNTGYLGYPVTLALVGPQFFGWAVLYDTLGSTLAAYGLGVVLAAHFGLKGKTHGQELLKALIQNPALWSFWLGLAGRTIPLSNSIEQILNGCAWGVVALSLLLLGMRLSQLTSWRSLRQASASLVLKMIVVPLVVGYGLRLVGVSGVPLLVLVLQSAMPPAFATLVIAEAYDLDRDLSVTILAIGSGLILLTLPLWLWLFQG